MVCALCLFLLTGALTSAAELPGNSPKPPSSGNSGGGGYTPAPCAGVDFESLLDGDSYAYCGEYSMPVAAGNMLLRAPVLYKIMGEEEEDGCLTLMSRHPVGVQGYTQDPEGQHYSDSYIRSWLNGVFFNGAFSQGEQRAVVETQVKTSVFNGSNEVTGPVSIRQNGPVADYPLTTNDKIYLPWAIPAENTAYWTSGGATGPAYRVNQPTSVFDSDSTSRNIYNRLRTPNYSSSGGYISSYALFGSYYSSTSNGIVTYVITSDPLTNIIASCYVIPIFKLDPGRIVFTSQIVPADTANPGPHQIKTGAAYPMPDAGKAYYRLTIVDESLDELAGSVYSGTELVGPGSILAVAEAGQLGLSMDFPATLGSGYSIRYKIVNSGNKLVGYGGMAGPFESGMNSFYLDACDLEGTPIADGTYSAFAWLQHDSVTTSFTASTPQYFCLAVGGEVEIDTPPLLSGGSASRSSNSNASVAFSSDKDGTCYCVVLPEGDAVPDASAIKGACEAGMDMHKGKNTVNLSALTAGPWKVYLVGEDLSGDSNVLGIAIPEYIAPTPPPPPPPNGNGGGGGTAIAKPELPLADPVSFPPFIQGFEDNTFRGDSLMTREQFVAILYRLNAERQIAPYAGDPSFYDVVYDRWSYDAVEWAKSEGIAEADENGNFRPAAPLTRAEMAAMFAKAEKLTEMAAGKFSDIDGHASADDILKAVKAGIFTGYNDGTFKPDDNTTRYEAVTALVRYLIGKEPTDAMWQGIAPAFADVAQTHWACKYVALAVNGYTGVPR